MHWNAEEVMNKKEELEHILHEENINICCIQETHLKKGKTFKIRGYQPFRWDRADRSKGGILTLVRNNIDASETAVHMEGAEYQMIRVKLNDTELHILNFYCPDNQPLSLSTINPQTQALLQLVTLTVTPRAGWTVKCIAEEKKWKTGKTNITSS